MAFELTPTVVTKLDTYDKYMREIGAISSYDLDKCFSCGLPSVWLYLKSIGLEELYFEILGKLKNRHLLFKELFYLLLLTNGTNKFFPHLPESFLKLQIPAEVKAAQLEVSEPEFEMAYSFTREQLKETLELIAKPGKMIRLGNKRKAVGVMYHDNVYDVYHADNAHALQFKSIDGCVDLIMRAIK